MDRDVAIRIDGMLLNVMGALDSICAYAQRNCSKGESRVIIRTIADAMGAMVDISLSLHKQHPDIVPHELDPNWDQEAWKPKTRKPKALKPQARTKTQKR